jgi:opacity protein-like surface antigen
MKERIMKKIFTVVISLMMLLMFSGVALSAEPAAPAAPEKQKPAKVAKVDKAKKKQHLKKSELTSGKYVSVQGGLPFLTDSDVSADNHLGDVETNRGYAFGVAFGKRLGGKYHPIRVEAELGYQKNEIDEVNNRDRSGDIKAYSLLLNGYYDFVKGKKIVPYITAGIGVAKVDADVNDFAHVDDIGLAYQVGAGVAYHINDNWHIDLKYRFMSVVDVNGFGIDNLNPEFASHNVFVGLRYRF